jgi:hypothetical protein
MASDCLWLSVASFLHVLIRGIGGGLIRGVLLALTELKVINSTPGSTRGQLGALGLLALGWLTLCPALAMRRVLCTFVSEDVVEVLRHFEFESFLNSLEPKLRTTVTCKDRAVYIKTSQWHALTAKRRGPGWHAGSWDLGGTKPGPGSDLEVQDNDKSADDLNSYWLQQCSCRRSST